MGKKLRGAALRAKKRAQEAVEELQERQAEEAVSKTVTTKTDQDLFVLDTTGDVVPHHERPSKAKSTENKQHKGLSEKDKLQVERLIEKHGKSVEKLQALVRQGQKILQDTRRRGLESGGAVVSTPNFDIWGEGTSSSKMVEPSPDQLSSPKTAVGSTVAGISPAHVGYKGRKSKPSSDKSKAMVALDLAKSGQSYHPDGKAHKQMILKAANLEIRRQKALEYEQAPLNQGLSPQTLALMKTVDSDDEEDEQQANDSEMAEEKSALMLKRQEKLTRAQRNKQKRLRQQAIAEENKKMAKKLLNEVSEIPRYKKELKRAEQERQKQRKERLALQMKLEQQPPGKDIEERVARQNPIAAPSIPVALPPELNSSLRKIKPKGNLMTDRITSLIDRRLAPKRTKEDDLHERLEAKKLKLSVKGRRNNVGVGEDFVVLA